MRFYAALMMFIIAGGIGQRACADEVFKYDYIQAGYQRTSTNDPAASDGKVEYSMYHVI